MSYLNQFSYHFYPVGQGLFASGAIRRYGEKVPRFLWVYDCGTTSSQDLVEQGIQRMKYFAGLRKRIDLLVISHFDHDHISGVVRLLQEFEIGTLMLPYMSLAQRLIIAFEEGSSGADSPLIDFYVNPVAFLQTQGGPGIELILFVPPSGNQGPSYPGESPNSQGDDPNGSPTIRFTPYKPNDVSDAESRMQSIQGKSTKVDFLAPGTKVTLDAHVWEFIPYNDDSEMVITKDFVEQVESERTNLMSAENATARNDSLKKLKKVYDEMFGSDSEARNSISLFLYSGPIYSTWKACYLAQGRSLCWSEAWRLRRLPLPYTYECDNPKLTEEQNRPRCSILYTGDGYLDTDDRLQKIITYLHKNRVRRIGIFQVMHHGAEANWHQGIATAIAPLFSIFSSDPERKKWKHPHASVLRDFWRYGAVQVDKYSNFTAYGVLYK